MGGARQTRFLYHVRRQAAEMSRSPCTQPCCSNLITRETKCTPLPQHAFLKILFSRIKFAGVILFQISISPTFMFRKVYRRCTKWITNSQNRRRATTQSRKSPVQSLKMPPKPAEQSDNNKMHGNARDLALSQITAPPAEVMDPYEALLVVSIFCSSSLLTYYLTSQSEIHERASSAIAHERRSLHRCEVYQKAERCT